MPYTLLHVALAAALSSLASLDALADTTISTTIGALTNSDASNLTIQPGAAIAGTTIGYVNAISTGTVNNRGNILIDNSTPNTYALSNTGTIQSILNAGNIGGYNGITNTIVTGTVTRIGVIGSLINSGTVAGYGNGLFNRGTISRLQNNAGGTISGSAIAGIYNAGNIATLTNAGVIKGNVGLYLASGTVGTLANSGSIIGGSGGALSNSGAIGVLSNSGVIAVTAAGYAISNSSSGSLITINNTGTIAGTISNLTAAGMTIHGAAGIVFGTLTGFNGAMGNIVHTGANLSFGSGNQLLNDNIVATGRTVSNVAGTLQLNNHVTITGNYVQATAAGMIFGVGNSATSTGTASDTGYGYLKVVGTTTLASGTTLVLAKLDAYQFAPGQRFVLIVTSGAASYNIADLKYSVAGYAGPVTAASVSAGGTDNLVLSLPAVPVAKPAEPLHRAKDNPPNWLVFDADKDVKPQPAVAAGVLNQNSEALLSGLLRYDGIDSGLLGAVNAVVALPTAAQASRAAAQLSPVAVKSSAAKSVNVAMDAVRMIAASHLDHLREGPYGCDKNAVRQESGHAAHTHGAAAWGQVMGGGIGMQKRDGVSGYRANYGGLLAGADAGASDCVRIGGLASYARIRIGNDDFNSGSSARVDFYNLTAYASFTGQGWYGNLMASAGRQDYRTSRALDFAGFAGNAEGSFAGRSYSAIVQGGFPLAVSADTTITPMAGLAYGSLRQDAYAETGGNGAALLVAAAGARSLKSDIGVKWQRTFATAQGPLSPSMQLHWRHEFGEERLRTTAVFAADTAGVTAFNSVGAAPGRNSGLLILSTTLRRGKNMNLMVNYFLEAALSYRAHSGDVRLTREF